MTRRALYELVAASDVRKGDVVRIPGKPYWTKADRDAEINHRGNVHIEGLDWTITYGATYPVHAWEAEAVAFLERRLPSAMSRRTN